MRQRAYIVSLVIGGIGCALLLGAPTSAYAQVSVNLAFPGVDIGFNMPTYPDLEPIPGYPVYYDPHANSNYFFYDGLYWVYRGDTWYASSWYNGPWQAERPEDVPLFVLRIPVRYYRDPPEYFHGWRADAPPRWGEHWGHDWEEHRHGWDHWDHHAAPRPAPLPVYQREYRGDRYPHEAEQQRTIRADHYRYEPHEAVTQRHFQPHENGPGPRAEPHGQRAEPERRHDERERKDEHGHEHDHK